MKNKARTALWLVTLFFLYGHAAATTHASPLPTPTPTPPLNAVRVGYCATLPEHQAWLEDERVRGLLMDARPFAINQATGRLSFSGRAGRVSIAHMNPFIYDYKITVAQQELVTTALTDFLKLLLPPNLGTLPGLQSGAVEVAGARATKTVKLKQIAERLDGMKPEQCKSSADSVAPAPPKTPACVAMGAMYEIFDELRDSGLFDGAGGAPLATTFTTITSPAIGPRAAGGVSVSARTAFAGYMRKLTALRNEDADAHTTCTAATHLNTTLGGYDFDAYFSALDAAKQVIDQAAAKAQDLETLAAAFIADQELTGATPVIRCKGYNCAGQFDAYAKGAREVLGDYEREIKALRESATEMQKTFLLTEQMKNKEGLFARTITVIKKFELSEATVSVNRTKINQAQTGQAGQGTQSGNANADGSGAGPQPVVQGGTSSDGSAATNPGGNNFAPRGPQSGTPTTGSTPPAQPAPGGGNNLAPAGQLTEVVQIGRPRFSLSGGLVYSPLPRRTFQSVKGFGRDAQGNPTGDGSANVVGFGENSSRRLLPMVMLNTRLADFDPVTLYFSTGVSAKRDDNVDVEYLFGPSVGLLNNRVLFTVGAYGGQTQNLVDDLALGDVLPDTIGDAKLFRKSQTWKPGFSFSYSFSPTRKKTVANITTTGTAARADDLKNEIRIGSIPFNLAVGMVYTTLEQRTYDEIVGFARDRQGNLTNGRTLTRIVGRTSSSDHRLTPTVFLHSRLTNFGGHDFYFTSGLTGKKTDNNFDIEYLLGGSFNLYRRKVFLTFGAFAGKQQLLGGDFFEGAALAKTQNVTLQNRYVWKPAFSFSYDVTKFIPRPR